MLISFAELYWLVSFELSLYVSMCRTNEVLERFCCLLAMFLLLVYFVVRLVSKEFVVIARKDWQV